MKKLTSKKGFTLIEMLVVIAIIAVLVAIIVPTVSSATTKAKAATDAANLRSAEAIVSIGILDGSITTEAQAKTALASIPQTSKTDSLALTVTFTAASGDKNATCTITYGSGDSAHDINYYAAKAGSAS